MVDGRVAPRPRGHEPERPRDHYQSVPAGGVGRVGDDSPSFQQPNWGKGTPRLHYPVTPQAGGGGGGEDDDWIL